MRKNLHCYTVSVCSLTSCCFTC